MIPVGHIENRPRKLVIVHGFGWPWGDALKDYQGLVDQLVTVSRECEGGFDIYLCGYDSWKGTARTITETLGAELENLLADPESRLILVGHSLGGILARRAALLIHGHGKGDLSRIERLVLLSSTNRGFDPVNPWYALARKVAHGLGIHLPIMDGLRGSTWMTQLRLDWLETFGGLPNFDPTSHASPTGRW